MRWLLVALLLVPAVSFAAETPQNPNARYAFVTTANEDFLMDVRTGQLWQKIRVTEETGIFFIPARFIFSDNRCSYSPTPKESELFKCFVGKENPPFIPLK